MIGRKLTKHVGLLGYSIDCFVTASHENTRRKKGLVKLTSPPFRSPINMGCMEQHIVTKRKK